MRASRAARAQADNSEAGARAEGAGDVGAAARPRAGASTQPRGDSDEEDDGEYQELGARGRQGQAAAAEAEEEEEEEDEPGAVTEKVKALSSMTDLEYLRSRTRTQLASDDDSDDDDEEDEGEDDDAMAAEGKGAVADAPAPPAPVPTALDEEEDDVSVSGRIFARNLAFTASEEELGELFSPFGTVTAVHVVLDRATGRSKGLAYVQFAEPACAVAALASLDGSTFQGRLLHLLPARRPPSQGVVIEAGGGGAGGGSFKAEKEAALRAGAGDARAWSTLFVRPDTVAAFLASRYAVSKADVLDHGSGDAAVRLALGEAQMVADTKAELEAAGVDVQALEEAARAPRGASAAPTVARSRTVLLLKNLPFTADEEELRQLAQRFGALATLILPSSRAMALMEYIEPSAARAAFAGLAYKRYQHVPLYVEWAPLGILPTPAQRSAAPPPAKPAKPAKQAPVTAADAAMAGGEGEDCGGAQQRTLYVKNLAWATEDATLRRHFEAALGGPACVRSARVARRPGPGKASGVMVSAGYGFVELDSEASCAKALRLLDGQALDGHALKVQRSRGGGAAAAEGDGGGSAAAPRGGAAGGTKLVVRNVAFEATKTDVRQLFAPFGQVKSLRLPRKFDGAHRGFAFVEMTTAAEARAAFEAVGGTHLYGRHLVTEWAQQEDGVNELRSKTARQFEAQTAAADGLLPAKKRSKRA